MGVWEKQGEMRVGMMWWERILGKKNEFDVSVQGNCYLKILQYFIKWEETLERIEQNMWYESEQERKEGKPYKQ